jgi:histidine triad (HIT) family protein
MNETEPTIFEKIIAGEIPSTKIYEEEDTFAFLDIQPHGPGHTLVIPKKPYENIHELPDEIAQSMIITVKKLSDAIRKAVKADGIKIVMNNGAAAGQIIFHTHVHIIPCFEGQDDTKDYVYSEGESERVAESIRNQIS